MLDDRVRRIGEDLGGTVAASYYREGNPEKQIAVLGEEIDAGLIMLGGQRQAPLERIFGANLAEKVPRTAVSSKVLHWSLESANRAPLARHHKKDAAARRRTAMPAGCTYLLVLDQNDRTFHKKTLLPRITGEEPTSGLEPLTCSLRVRQYALQGLA